MRRKDREVTDFEKVKEVIAHCDVIRLGIKDEPCPYIVPMNFGYEIKDKQIFFYLHGAMAGRKYELLQSQPTVSFEMDCNHKLEVLPEHGDITMRYECLMGLAKVEFIHEEEKEHIMDIILSRDERTKGFDYPKSKLSRTAIIRLTVQSWTCKINASQGGPD